MAEDAPDYALSEPVPWMAADCARAGTVLGGDAHQAAEVFQRTQVGVHGFVAALIGADGPWAARLAGRGLAVVGALAVRAADGVDGRQVDDVEPHAADVRQPLDSLGIAGKAGEKIQDHALAQAPFAGPHLVHLEAFEHHLGQHRTGRDQVDTAPIESHQVGALVGRLGDELARHYGVRSQPTLMLFKHGSVEAQKVGALSKSQLKAFIDLNL